MIPNPPLQRLRFASRSCPLVAAVKEVARMMEPGQPLDEIQSAKLSRAMAWIVLGHGFVILALVVYGVLFSHE